MSNTNPHPPRPRERSADESPAAAGEPATPPIYRKPSVRRYDQIEQVKPYGPSEMEAG